MSSNVGRTRLGGAGAIAATPERELPALALPIAGLARGTTFVETWPTRLEAEGDLEMAEKKELFCVLTELGGDCRSGAACLSLVMSSSMSMTSPTSAPRPIALAADAEGRCWLTGPATLASHDPYERGDGAGDELDEVGRLAEGATGATIGTVRVPLVSEAGTVGVASSASAARGAGSASTASVGADDP
jgi:hypothetical protein